VILTRRVFVILLLFCSRTCPRWSSTRSTTPALSCGCAPGWPWPTGRARVCGDASRRVHPWHVRRAHARLLPGAAAGAVSGSPDAH